MKVGTYLATKADLRSATVVPGSAQLSGHRPFSGTLSHAAE